MEGVATNTVHTDKDFIASMAYILSVCTIGDRILRILEKVALEMDKKELQEITEGCFESLKDCVNGVTVDINYRPTIQIRKMCKENEKQFIVLMQQHILTDENSSTTEMVAKILFNLWLVVGDLINCVPTAYNSVEWPMLYHGILDVLNFLYPDTNVEQLKENAGWRSVYDTINNTLMGLEEGEEPIPAWEQ